MFTQKKYLYRILTVLVLLGTFHLAMTTGIPTVFAQAADPADVSKAHEAFIKILSMITTFMQILLLIILNMLGYLLQGDFFNDSKMMSSLNQIWILSRNMMNVIFAIMLIGVAFYTIITAKAELIKSKWSQFVLAVVFVNFSWFFPRVIIDVANVLTATVYSIPNMLPNPECMTFGDKPGDPLKKCRIITDMKVLPGGKVAQAIWWGTCMFRTGNNRTCTCNELACLRKEDYPGVNIGAAHAMINGMAVSFIHIDSLTQIPPGTFSGPPLAGGTMAQFETTLKIMINVMTVFVVQISVTLPLIALGVGLFIRILILWVTIAFMPFTFLGLVINGKLGTNVFGFETDIWKEFINAAFLPAVVGIPFVIGFIMLKTMVKVPSPPGFPQDWGVPMINGVGSWWAFLWMMAAVAIIYTGAFAALRRSAITGKITDKIKAFGDSAFNTAIQLPLLTPLPVPAGSKPMNLGGMLHAPGAIGQNIRLKARGINPPDPDEARRRAAAAAAAGAVPVPGAVPHEISAVAATSLMAGQQNTQLIVDAIHTLGNNTSTQAMLQQAMTNFTTILGGQGKNPTERLQNFKTHVDGNVRLQGIIAPGEIQKAIDKAAVTPNLQ